MRLVGGQGTGERGQGGGGGHHYYYFSVFCGGGGRALLICETEDRGRAGDWSSAEAMRLWCGLHILHIHRQYKA